MKNSFGESVIITLFGESHGDGIGAVLDGICPGIKIDFDLLKNDMKRRLGIPEISTHRREADEVLILSGVKDGVTEGTPIAFLIKNKDAVSSENYGKFPRPSHADLTAMAKYHGFQDIRGGGHFSGRITAPLVAAGSICKTALSSKGIKIYTHIKSIKDIEDTPLSFTDSEFDLLENSIFPVISDEKKKEMTKAIIKARDDGDSIGGIIECIVRGVPEGIGEPFFDTLEGEIAKMMFSIPSVKGIEFGKGFGISKLCGSAANDELSISDGKIKYLSNNNGGIIGGISSGEDIIFSVAIKPTPTISKKQKTFDLETSENTEISFGGRNDPCIVPRVAVVIENAASDVILNEMAKRFGTDFYGA